MAFRTNLQRESPDGRSAGCRHLFRDDDRDAQFEIPRCAIAQLWFSPDGLPRNDGGDGAV